MAQNPTISQLDPGQIIKRVYDEANDQIRTGATIVAEIGSIDVSISQVDDSIRIGDGTDLVTTTTIGSSTGLDVNVISSTATSVQIDGLDAFQSSVYTIDNITILQLFNPAFTNRSVVTMKAVCTGTNYISIKENSNPLTIGWPLFNGDTLQMDLKGTQNIYAIATAAGQILHGIEMGG